MTLPILVRLGWSVSVGIIFRFSGLHCRIGSHEMAVSLSLS
jgi:hypothetical protein